MSILVGTAGWADPALIQCKRFYPRGVSTAEARLKYYATQFPMVEVDASYYTMPSPRNSQLWAERTPDDFVMNMKAFRLFTGHNTSPAALPGDIQYALGPRLKPQIYYRDIPPDIRDELWRRFIEALAPLQSTRKLGAVHFQFAPWITNSRAGRAHIEHCAERMAGHTMAVELRSRTWFEGSNAASTLAFERERKLVHVVVDEPQGFDNSIPAVWETTSPDLAIVRLHGRNAEAWNAARTSASSGRFNYNYPEAELMALTRDVRAISRFVDSLHVVFNNNNEDQGQRNGKSFKHMLENQDAGLVQLT